MATITPFGSEFRVNTATVSSQQFSYVTALGNGGYLVTWTSFNQDGSSNGIFAQRYNADGSKADGEFQVNTTTDDGQVLSKAAVLEDGGFVITWMSRSQDGPPGDTTYGVYAQRYNADGVAEGGEFRVNTYVDNEQREPSIAALDDGGFVIVWMSQLQEGGTNPEYGIYAQRYDASGAAVGNEFLVNTTTQGRQIEPDVTGLANGGFVVTWSADNQDIYAQVYDASGAAVGGEFRLNTYISGEQFKPVITALADGGFVVTWVSAGQDGSLWGIFAQRFDASGLAVGDEFQVNTYTEGYQDDPAVAALADGGFVVTWISMDQDGDNNGIYAQRFDANGAKVGKEALINTVTESYQYQPTIAGLDDGGFIISWTSFGQDGSGVGVYAQQFDARLFGTKGDDEISDTVGANWMNGRRGDDTLYGLDGDDRIRGAAGNDTLYGGEGKDRLKGNKGDDTLYGGADNDRLRGQAGDDTLVGGAGRDALRGGAGADTFVFNEIADSVAGAVDRIMDFEVGIDVIDFSAFAGTFAFIGSDGFSGTGAEIRVVENGTNTFLRIDVDGDGVADMKIFVKGLPLLTVDDFIL